MSGLRACYIFLSFICFALFPAGEALAQGRDNAADYAAYGGKPLNLPADKAPLFFATDKGEQAFTVEIAHSEEEKARGLMYRRLFPKNRAMLFVFAPEERVITMWMENTPLPLDMVFTDKRGKITYIYYNAAPFSRNLISSLHPVSYVIELNAGQAAAKGLKAGQKVLHPVICGKCA